MLQSLLLLPPKTLSVLRELALDLALLHSNLDINLDATATATNLLEQCTGGRKARSKLISKGESGSR